MSSWETPGDRIRAVLAERGIDDQETRELLVTDLATVIHIALSEQRTQIAEAVRAARSDYNPGYAGQSARRALERVARTITEGGL